MNIIPEHHDKLVQGVPGHRPQLNAWRSFTQYGQYREWVNAVRAEAAAHHGRLYTLLHSFMIVEVTD
jgi:hypothetical protein